MSQATNHLLHRGGRNQYGITSEDLPRRMSFEDKKALESEYVSRHKEKWLALFINFNKKQSWELLFSKPMKYRTLSLSSFYSELREYESVEEYLLNFLLTRKEVALELMGFSDDDAHKVIKEFNQKYYS
ncbi:hypothetical protein [Pseudocolwellia sp. HL-MZ7]|uniref:hypothetical protein n=1 Tax=Pseudocolwellia sp. HL-MZ7 TaxID=3400627 RepID=UPI003CF5353D